MNHREFGRRCQLCNKYKESHMYPFKVKGKFRRLCRECWDVVQKSNSVNHVTSGGTQSPQNEKGT